MEFKKVFIKLSIENFVEKYDMVKLCLLYFLKCDILGEESQNTIDVEHFSKVEDLDYFNQYPWCLESYKATIMSLHKVF